MYCKGNQLCIRTGFYTEGASEYLLLVLGLDKRMCKSDSCTDKEQASAFRANVFDGAATKQTLC